MFIADLQLNYYNYPLSNIYCLSGIYSLQGKEPAKEAASYGHHRSGSPLRI